jgi:hypothetical protein
MQFLLLVYDHDKRWNKVAIILIREPFRWTGTGQ